MAADYSNTSVNEWVSVIRRARIGRTVKLVALTVASYADPDGGSVFPGRIRLAVECEVSESTIRDSLRTLREVGLIEVVRRGNRRRGQADRYRLILAPDLLERVDVLSPDAVREEINARKDARAEREQERAHRRPAAKSGTTMAVPERRIRDSGSAGLGTTQNVPHPPSDPSITTDPPSVPLTRDQRALTANESTRRPWAYLQNGYDRGRYDSGAVIEAIEATVGGFDAAEERTALGMLESGSHVKAVANTIEAHRRGACPDCQTWLDPDRQCRTRSCTNYQNGPL
jgi:DNA-binding transcriptional ArsR family regulator